MNRSIALLHKVDDPLGLFFRSGRDDHNVLKQLLSENKVGMLGGVFGPLYVDRQEDLRVELLRRDLDAILDTGMMEMATGGGHSRARQSLPWALPNPHASSDFSPSYCDEVCEKMAAFIATKKFSAVLAPTHFLEDGPKDPWFEVDQLLAKGLRERLDANGCKRVVINYPLAIPTRFFVEPNSRNKIKESVADLPVQALWLRVHPFGSDCSGAAVLRFILACQEMHTAKIPLIAEKVGTLALPLLAFGAVTGVDCGVNSGEKFDFSRFKVARNRKDKFGRTVRVYIPDLGGFLPRNLADQLFNMRAFKQYACRDTGCCRNGADTMLTDARRHGAYARMGEIDELSNTPPSLRPNRYLEQFLRPATDNIKRVLAHTGLSNELRKALERSDAKQADWRKTLGDLSRLGCASISAPFERCVQRQTATA